LDPDTGGQGGPVPVRHRLRRDLLDDDIDVSALRPFLKGSVEFGGAVDQNTG